MGNAAAPAPSDVNAGAYNIIVSPDGVVVVG
jgi:hypothetical protein